MKKIEIGAKYKHFKGGEYKVIGIAKHSENLEDFVVYKALYDEKKFWIRPKKMFLEIVKIGNKKVQRFQKINQKILVKSNKK